MKFTSTFAIVRQAMAGLFVSVLFVSSPTSVAGEYILNEGHSRLMFTAVQQGIEFEGRFESFYTQIFFDPANLSGSVVRATVDLATVDTQNPDRDSYLLNEEWFNVTNWPTAVFDTTDIRRQGNNEYLADASLTLRDITGPVQMRFSFESMPDGGARLIGTVKLMRLDFGIGQGDWTDTSWIGNPVRVSIDLQLDPLASPD